MALSPRVALSFLALLVLSSILLVSVHAGLVSQPSYYDNIPVAPCSGHATEHIGKGVKFVVNGTMAVLKAQIGPATWDDNNVLVFLLKNLTEQFRSPDSTRACDSDIPVGNSVDLAMCSCQQSTYLNESSGWKDEGVQFVLTNCPGHADLLVRFYLAIPNVTHEDFYDNLMNGSTVNNFTYVHPYVDALQRPELKQREGATTPFVDPFSRLL